MREFFEKHKSNLLKPILMIALGLVIWILGYSNGQVSPVSMIIGAGPVVFGGRRIAEMFFNSEE